MMRTIERKRTSDTAFLLDYLRDCHATGKLVSYEELEEKLGQPLSRFRSKLSAAITHAKEYHEILFRNIRGYGYLPLANGEAAEVVTTKRQKRIRSEVNNWGGEINAIETETLTPQEVQQYTLSCSKLSVAELMLSESVNKRLEEKVKKPELTNTRRVDPNESMRYAREAVLELYYVS